MATYIDNTTAGAFVDDTVSLARFAGTDAGSTPYYIKLTDAAAKTKTGYLGAAGAGETTSEVLTDGGLENWASATNLTSWSESVTGTSTINQETVNMRTGAACARLDIDSSNNLAYFYQGVTLVNAGLYRIGVWYKNSIAGKSAAIQLYGLDPSTQYLKSNGQWQAGSTLIILPSSTDLAQFQITLNAPETGSTFYLRLRNASAASSSIYFDDVSLARITDPDSTGLHVYDGYNSTDRGWAATDAGFDPITIASYSVYSSIPNIASITPLGGIATVITV
jgi:hypothetical protein